MVYLALLSFVLGYAVFWYGGVDPFQLALALAALGCISVVFYWRLSLQQSAPSLSSGLKWLGLLLPAYVAFQVLPMPHPVVEVLSPARAELTQTLESAVGDVNFSTLSVMPSVTFAHLIRIFALILVFLLVRQLIWRWAEGPWVVAAPVIIIAGLEAALGVAQYSGWAPLASGTYVNRNHYAGLLEMALPFALMYPVAVMSRSRSRRSSEARPALKAAGVLCLATLILIAILFSLSRMGFVASLISLALMAALALRPAARSWAVPARASLSIGSVLLVVLVVLAFLFLPSDTLIGRFAALSSTEEITAEGRLLLAHETLDLIAAYPLFGCGLGGYESAFLKYKVSEPLVSDPYAHNDYLQVLAELGVIGLVVVTVLVLTLLAKAVRAASRHSDPNSRYLALACFGSMTAILLHSLVDFNLYIPANSMLFAWVCGIAVGLGVDRQHQSVWRRMGLPEIVDILPADRKHKRGVTGLRNV